MGAGAGPTKEELLRRSMPNLNNTMVRRPASSTSAVGAAAAAAAATGGVSTGAAAAPIGGLLHRLHGSSDSGLRPPNVGAQVNGAQQVRLEIFFTWKL